jgi:hypothetical protein
MSMFVPTQMVQEKRQDILPVADKLFLDDTLLEQNI